MTFLYRCMAHIEDATGKTSNPDVHVLFECVPLVDPKQRAQQLLASMWNTPVDLIVVYNVISAERMLNFWAVGPASTGDARLMEIGRGDNGAVAYIPPERCLMAVGPANLQRLASAMRDAQALAAAGYTVTDEVAE